MLSLFVKGAYVLLKVFPYIKKLQVFYSRQVGYNFIIEELEKHVTVYKNGNGIIRETIKFNTINPDEFTQFPRRLNIEDAKKDTEFAALEVLKMVDREKRFSEMGFWCESDTNLINNVIEYYWQDDPSKTGENIKAKNNPKEIRFRFDINNGATASKKKNTINYAFSIPGMFPITDGHFDESVAPYPDYSFGSGIRMDYIVNKMKYTISFEKGIELQNLPTFKIVSNVPNGNKRDDDISCKQSSNLFYDSFSAETKKPRLNSRIKCSWEVKPLSAHIKSNNKEADVTV